MFKTSLGKFKVSPSYIVKPCPKKANNNNNNNNPPRSQPNQGSRRHVYKYKTSLKEVKIQINGKLFCVYGLEDLTF
jgi:hypothetical protein